MVYSQGGRRRHPKKKGIGSKGLARRGEGFREQENTKSICNF